jgi:hypothetical protein
MEGAGPADKPEGWNMDVTATSAANLYHFQTALASSGQASAIFGALTQSYAQASAGLASGGGDLSSVVGQANLGPLVSAIYAQSGAQGALQDLGASGLVGGLDANAASALLFNLGGDSSSSLSGFESAVQSRTTLASTAADALKAYGSGTVTQLAQAEAPAATGQDAGTLAVQAAFAAQQNILNTTFTLLA